MQKGPKGSSGGAIGRPYRLLILLFALFALLQFATGGLIYCYKVGTSYEATLAYYKGTEEAEDIIGSPISAPVFQARSLYGLLEVAYAHAAAYGLLCFIVAHLLRSLSANSRWSNILSIAIFCLAFLEIGSTFATRYGPAWFSWLRLAILYLFIAAGSLSCGALLWLSCAAIPKKRDFFAPIAKK